MRNFIIAIDPGTKASGVVMVRSEDLKPFMAAKIENEKVTERVFEVLKSLYILPESVDVVIEMIQGRFNQGFGSELLETAVWIGRFMEQLNLDGRIPDRVLRMDEYKALCANVYTRNDKGVRDALVDRFAYGVQNYGKGTKKDPGWFYGFSADVWQAYAVAVTWADLQKEKANA